jgi:MFS family permease
VSAAVSPGAGSGLVVLRSRVGAALIAATVLASASGTLDASASQVAVPAIGRSLHAGVAGLQWTLTGYLLAVAALLLLSGALADRFGRRRLVTVGLCTMLVAAVGCALSPSIGVLIGARVAQGIGGAMVVPSSLAMLNGTLQPDDRARGIGIWAGLETLAVSVGPYAAGWLVDHASWRVVFLLSAPLIVICLVVLRRVPDIASERRSQPIDLVGGALAVLGLDGLVYALTAGPDAG